MAQKHTQAAEPVPHARGASRGHDRRGLRRGVSLLPSLFTLANLFCGWACVVHAMRGELATAAPFIGVAVVLDMLDGRIARMTGTTSDFGVQLDSLADLISFGMAPAVLAFQWGLIPLGRMGWAVGFLYLTAAALRLARFNIQVNSDKRYFIGLPSPAAAGLVAATVFYFPEGLQAKPMAWLGMVMLIVPAVLMVSTIRFQSFKTFDLGIRRGFRGLMLVAAFIALLVAYPHELLMVIAYAYFASGFIGELMRARPSRQEAAILPTVETRARASRTGRRLAAVTHCGSVIVTLVPRPFSDVTAIVPPIGFDVALRNRQAEAGADRLRREIRLEDLRDRFGVHADAGVGDAQLHHADPARAPHRPSACRRSASRAARSRSRWSARGRSACDRS